MRNSRVQLPTLLAAATAAIIFLLFISGDLSSSPRMALASHAGGADKFLIDMDPAGNTATSLGAIQDCARINKNGVQDADEDAVDTVSIDVVAINIPASHPMIAFEVGIRHGTGIVVDSADFSMMLAAIPGSEITITDIFQGGPDTTLLVAFDSPQPPAVTAESGSGVLVRTALRAVTGGPSISPITLFGSGHVDPMSAGFAPDNSFDASFNDVDNWQLPSSRIAVDQACPAPLGSTDVAVTDVGTIVPANIYAGGQFAVQTITTLNNLGPDTVSGYIVKGVPGVGCAFAGDARIPVSGPPIPAGGSVSVAFTTSFVCSTPGTITHAGYAAAIILDAIDTDLANNVRQTSFLTLTVLPNDPDGDGVRGAVDLCPGTLAGHPVDAAGCSDGQVDADGDGICSPGAPSGGPSACTGVENCPSIPNPGQEDTNGDGTADACESQPPIAVGGVLGLFDRAEPPRLSPEEEPTRPLPPVVVVAAALAAAVLGALWVRRLRR